jgi:hypothetical protein
MLYDTIIYHGAYEQSNSNTKKELLENIDDYIKLLHSNYDDERLAQLLSVSFPGTVPRWNHM